MGRVKYCRKIVMDQICYFIGENTSKDKDGAFDTIFSKFNSFFNDACAKIAYP